MLKLVFYDLSYGTIMSNTILYIITNYVCVRASVRPSDDVLGAFSVAEPATETMTTGY